MTKQEILQQCTVEGMTVKLPLGQLDRKLYLEVSNALELIGGRWKGGRIMGFVFPQDPTELLSQIANGEKRNLKKEYQFFPTPDHIADRLVALANIPKGISEAKILEPSAGQGAIVKAIHRHLGMVDVYAFELMDVNRTFLKQIPKVKLSKENDFLNYETDRAKFDYIIANPPFSGNQDISHINHMYNLLKPNGRLVTIASTHWTESTNKKETEFRQWLDDKNASITYLASGEFKESGTGIPTTIIVLDKQEN